MSSSHEMIHEQNEIFKDINESCEVLDNENKFLSQKIRMWKEYGYNPYNRYPDIPSEECGDEISKTNYLKTKIEEIQKMREGLAEDFEQSKLKFDQDFYKRGVSPNSRRIFSETRRRWNDNLLSNRFSRKRNDNEMEIVTVHPVEYIPRPGPVVREKFQKPEPAPPTLPIPFSMEFRRKKNRIIKKKFDVYMKEVEDKENEELNKRFVAKPVPFSTLEKRYKELCFMRDLRSQEIREKSKKWLKKREKPFDFTINGEYEKKKKKNLERLKRQYDPRKELRSPPKARPVPPSTGQALWDKIMRRREERKSRRVGRRKEELLSMSRFPPRMEMWYNKYGLHQKKKSEFRDKELTYHPEVNHYIPPFKYLQDKYAMELGKIKKERMKKLYSTRVEPFEFQKRNNPDDSRFRILHDIEEDKKNLKETRWPYLGKRGKCDIVPVPLFTVLHQNPEFEVGSTFANEMRNITIKERMTKLKLRKERENMRNNFGNGKTIKKRRKKMK